MEYVNLQARLVLILCANFLISPHEIGFSNLEPNKASLGEGTGKQEEIVQSEDQGLRPLIETLFSTVQKLQNQTFPQAKNIIELTPVGLGENTKESDLNMYKEELQTTATFSKIWKESERNESFPFGGFVPTSPVFHQSVARYMKYSEFRYYFMNDDSALEDPSYDFIVDPAMNQAYQELKTGMDDKRAQQADLQIEQQKTEIEGQQSQMEMMQQEQEGQGEEEPSPEELEQSEQENQMQEMEQERAMEEVEMKKQKHLQDMKHKEEKHKAQMASLAEAFKEKQNPRKVLNVLRSVKKPH